LGENKIPDISDVVQNLYDSVHSAKGGQAAVHTAKGEVHAKTQ